jgi:site-specific DNA recombinase
MSTAAGYIRISIKDQSLYSLGHQEKVIQDYCARNNLHLLQVFTDNGQSSYTFDRPDWKKLEKFLKDNRAVKYLIIFDYDRFSRNIAEALFKIKELQDKYKIKVLSTNDAIDTDFDDPMTFMSRAFKLMVGESELHRIRKRTKDSKVALAMSGRPSCKAPFGYVNSRDQYGKAILTIDVLKAEVVKEMFAMYVTGSSVVSINAFAKSKGYELKGKSVIQRMMCNCIYAGLIKVPVKTGAAKYVKGLHTAIIDELTYHKAKERFLQKTKTNHYNTNDETYLKGSLRCWCGKLLTVSNPKGRHGKHFWYYLCGDHKQNFLARRLHEKFDQMLSVLSFNETELQWFRTQMLLKVEEHFAGKGNRAAVLNEELGKIKQQINFTEQKFLLTDNISVEHYNQVINEMNVRRSTAEAELATLKESKQSYIHKVDTVLQYISGLDKLFHILNPDKKRQMIDYLFGGVLYYSPNSYRTPYASPIVANKLTELQKFDLLKIEKPSVSMLGLPSLGGKGGNYRTQMDFLFELYEIIAA